MPRRSFVRRNGLQRFVGFNFWQSTSWNMHLLMKSCPGWRMCVGLTAALFERWPMRCSGARSFYTSSSRGFSNCHNRTADGFNIGRTVRAGDETARVAMLKVAGMAVLRQG